MSGAGDAALGGSSSLDKYIGLGLAISSSLAIGTSFIITKKGLIDAADKHDGFSSDSYSYLKNGIWWAGMITMVIGEVANFAAYTFAPPILVTPLGALSVLIGAILASFFLGEELGKIGRVGSSLCLVGTIIIILNAPEEHDIGSVDELLQYALSWPFIVYCLFVLVTSLYIVFRIAPTHGTKNPIVYIAVCSLVGSISVMAVKGFGVAIKLTLAGNNQLFRFGTWFFAVTVGCCIAVQMNYFNKALDLFSTNVVNPMYYVCFTTSTIVASLILFKGFNTTDVSSTVSLICGFYIIASGVYLLNLSRIDPNGESSRGVHSAIPTDDRISNAGRGSSVRHTASMSRPSRHSFLEAGGILGPRLSLSGSRYDEREPALPLTNTTHLPKASEETNLFRVDEDEDPEADDDGWGSNEWAK